MFFLKFMILFNTSCCLHYLNGVKFNQGCCTRKLFSLVSERCFLLDFSLSLSLPPDSRAPITTKLKISYNTLVNRDSVARPWSGNSLHLKTLKDPHKKVISKLFAIITFILITVIRKIILKTSVFFSTFFFFL